MAYSPEQIERARQVIALREVAITYKAGHKREFAPAWYPWQQAMFGAGATHRERLVLAGNRSGKTSSAGFEIACHLTGCYPDDWSGERINHPILCWAFGVDSSQVRDVLQKELMGKSRDDGYSGGWIHPDEIVPGSIERSQIPGAVRELRVKHVSGGESTLSFKSYTQIATGQSSLPIAGSSVDLAWVDEQPPDELIGQLITRLMTGRRGKGGLVLYSMTPELGKTDLVAQFMDNPAAHQCLIGPVSWDECPHLTPEIREQTLSSFPVHEREMRSLGIPLYGTGRIFRPDETKLVIDPFDLNTKPWLRVIKGLDVGIAHPTAVAWLAYDPEQRITYLVRTYRASDEKAAVHGAAVNAMWPNAPTAYPPDADTREKGSGQSLLPLYGINHPRLFENPDGSRSREAGIMAMQEAMAMDTFKVFRGQCEEFLQEIRGYHRDAKGNIVDVHDDVISAVRYAFQMVGRYGVTLNERNQAYTGGLYPDLGLRERGRKRA